MHPDSMVVYKAVHGPLLPNSGIPTMPRPQIYGPPLTYESIQKLTDLNINTLHQAGGKPKPGRQRLDIQSLESVVLWLAAHGKRKLRIQLCGLSAQALLDGEVTPGTTHGAPRRAIKKKTKKRAAKRS